MSGAWALVLALQVLQLAVTGWLASRVLQGTRGVAAAEVAPEAVDLVPGGSVTEGGVVVACEVDQGQVRVTATGAAAQAVWVRGPDGWRSLHGGGPWRGPEHLETVDVVRVWLGEGTGVHAGALRAAAMLTPWPASVPTGRAGDKGAGAIDVAVWRDVTTRAVRAGLLGLPAAEEVEGMGTRGAVQAACWLAMEIARAHRESMGDRAAVERCELLSRRVLAEAAVVVEALGDGVRLEVRPPPGVSVRDPRWLVDTQVARALGNPVVNDLLQPLVVLRPAVLQGDTVLLAGEVA